MGSNYSSYERELKGVLQGEEDSLRRYSRLASSPEDLQRLRQLQERPFLVVRAAGSHGFDLVALRDRVILPIEVKASAQETVSFSAASGRALEQYRQLVAQTGSARLVLYYAFRNLGHRGEDPWRIFAAPGAGTGLQGYPEIIAKGVPPVEVTAHGNQILHWEKGKPLLEFLDRILYLLSTGP